MENVASPEQEATDTNLPEPANHLKRFRFFGFGKKKQQKTSAADRRHERYECENLLGNLAIMNSSNNMVGYVIEVSKGGLKFRPAKSYLLERKDVQITIEFAGLRLPGKIVATRSDGFGIALFDMLTDEQMMSILQVGDLQPTEAA
ncbi:MAG: PilZ domain-containing protein [Pseudomonadota bacterium]